MQRRNKGPTTTELLSAIRRKCMDCSGNMRSEVQGCKIKGCSLYPYRRDAINDEGQVRMNVNGHGQVTICTNASDI